VPFPVPTSVQLAVPVRRRRPCRFRLDDGLLGRRPCRFLRQRFLRRLSWHCLCRRPSCCSLNQRRPRLHRKRRLSSFVTLPLLSAMQPPAPTVVRSRLRCLSPYRRPYNLPCRSVADGRAAYDSMTAFSGRRPCRFLRQRFLRRLSWHYLCRRLSCRSLSQRGPRLHRKRRLSSFVTPPMLFAVRSPAPTVVRSRLRCLSPYRRPYNLPCRSVADGRAAFDSTTAFSGRRPCRFLRQ
jgi:hypothetical protein